ncbi:MAG: hypothetical protein RML32_09440, partial [Gammaproteobacteria bacterium]|nr:hypothetical protein [Gammaproteobacteria bacterium]
RRRLNRGGNSLLLLGRALCFLSLFGRLTCGNHGGRDGPTGEVQRSAGSSDFRYFFDTLFQLAAASE